MTKVRNGYCGESQKGMGMDKCSIAQSSMEGFIKILNNTVMESRQCNFLSH